MTTAKTESLSSAERPDATVSSLVYATIAATIAVAFNGRASIFSVQPAATVMPDPQMFHWSLEGRRAIYSSHQFR